MSVLRVRAQILWQDVKARVSRKNVSLSCHVGHSPQDEVLPVLNDNLKVVGRVSRQDVHSMGLLHPTVHLLLFNGQGRLLVQKRGSREDRFPGRLASSVGGHVNIFQSPEEALRQETQQEIGIEHLSFNFVSTYFYISNRGLNKEIVSLYTGTYDGEIIINPAEVKWAAWFDFPGISRLTEIRPEMFATSFLEDLKIFQNIH